MATKKFSSIWIFLGILVIAALLLGFATSAGAQTYTMKCRETGHLPKVHSLEVGDLPGHLIGVAELVGVLSCDDGSVATTSNKASWDYIKGSGKALGYWVATFEDGSTFWATLHTITTLNPDGKTSNWEAPFEYIKGTGRFQGIQGSGSAIGKRFTPVPGVAAQYYFDWIGTYTLQSK